MDASGCSADSFPFVVMGNKCDKEDERDVSKEMAEEWCKENGNIPYYETSALNNIGVDDGFISVIN